MIVPNEKYDLLARVRTDVLYPPFLVRINTMLNRCVARGAFYVATSGRRTYEEQDALYAKGRTAPGGKVTNAKGGESEHNFAIALDFARHALPTYAGKLVPEYDDVFYDILGEEAARVGLEWGGKWKSIVDAQHVQLSIKRYGIKLADLDIVYRQGGYEAVFAYLDRFPW